MQKAVLILESTQAISRPLYRHLRQSLQNPVQCVPANQSEKAATALYTLSRDAEVCAIPTDECSLNRLTAIVNEAPDIASRIVIPGNATLSRRYSPSELSNKTLLHSLFKRGDFSSFTAIESVDFCWSGNNEDAAACEKLCYPVVLKPSDKDPRDAFTRRFPSKIVVLDSLGQLLDLLRGEPELFINRRLQVQPLVKGVNISWFGYRSNGKTSGFCISPLVKSPKAAFGGTTTLAKRIPADVAIAAAAEEIGAFLSLEGIFEIEFLRNEKGLFFFYEINPRPILQTALALGKPNDLFVDYLASIGFSRSNAAATRDALSCWGSVSRYLYLNKKQDVQMQTLLRILVHEIMFTRFFSFNEKRRYCIDLARQIKTTFLSSGK